MTWNPNRPTEIIRTERGLSIAGTRTSLYAVIDLLKADYPPSLIRNTFNLTDEQINAALSYIEANRTEIETEYQEVLQTREEIRQYWEEHNCDRAGHASAAPYTPEQKAFWAKIEEKRARCATQQCRTALTK